MFRGMVRNLQGELLFMLKKNIVTFCDYIWFETSLQLLKKKNMFVSSSNLRFYTRTLTSEVPRSHKRGFLWNCKEVTNLM
jgi:hypothetical protein